MTTKKILLIDGDAGFARELSAAIEARGLEARVSGDGKEGLELARATRPDAIVLCVELPKMSGYAVCNKLKKDEALKSIPLVITSAEATEETFEAHRKLKAHAEEYLAKPFDPAALLQKIARLVELPPEPAELVAAADAEAVAADADVVTLEDVEEVELLDAGEPLPEADAPGAASLSPGLEDEDLKLLDEAFEHIATDVPAPLPAAPAAAALAAQPDAPPAAEEAVAVDAGQELAPAPEAELAIAGVEGSQPEPVAIATSADAELAPALEAADLLPVDPDVAEPEAAAAVDAQPGAVPELGAAEPSFEIASAGAGGAAAPGAEAHALPEVEPADLTADAELRLEALRTEAEVADGPSGADLEAAVADADARAAGAEARASAAEARAHAADARAEAAEARASAAEARSAELERRLAELTASAAAHEASLTRAQARAKSGDRAREKARKALAIALELLEDPAGPQR